MFLVLVLLLLLLVVGGFHALVTKTRLGSSELHRRRSHGSGCDPCHGPPAVPSPPRSSMLPILGHLHLVSARQPHVSLRDLARKHGDDGLLLLRLGQVWNLVVLSPRAAEAVLRAHDHTFASRPPSAVAAVLFSGPADVALAPYGEPWRQARKVVTAHLLSARKVSALRRAREEETRLALRGIASDTVVDVGDLVGAYASDVVCRAVSGRFSRDRGRNRTFRELSSGNTAVLGGFNLDDMFPGLARVEDALTGMVCARARRLKRKWHRLLDEIIDEHHASLLLHRSNRRRGQQEEEDEQEEDFIDVLLSLHQREDSTTPITREQIKVLLMDVFAAGTDTSSILLEYAMAELVRHPDVMTKLRAEIGGNTPPEQDMVTEEDLTKMPYLKAVVKETLRLHPPVPLLLPRISMDRCDDVMNGYSVPGGTRVIVNAWALGRDAASWERAEEFTPERFLLLAPAGPGDDDTNNNGTNHLKKKKGGGSRVDWRFLPFGAGRRMCPGMNLGLATVEIMLANLVHRFHWDLPPGTKREDIDMTEVFGLTMRRQQKLLLVPRLILKQ